MKRLHWSFLLCVAVFALAPSMALAFTDFQATRISTLELGSTSGPGGLIELQNTGFVITDIKDSTYVHWNPPGSPIPYVVDTGFAAIAQAVKDGFDNGAWDGLGGGSSTPQGIVGVNAAGGYVGIGSGLVPNNLYSIGFDTVSDLGIQLPVMWGGVTLTASDANDMLIRETYAGDSTLKGYVDTGHDFTKWLDAYAQNAAPPYAGSPAVGLCAGDAGLYSLATGNPVDTGHDLTAWLTAYGNAGNLGGFSSVPDADSSGGDTVPEPNSLVMLGFAAFLGLVFVGKRSLRAILGFLRSSTFHGWKATGRMRRFLLGLLTGFVVLTFAASAGRTGLLVAPRIQRS